MPIFSNKFTPKKSPLRRVTSSFNETQKAMEDMSNEGNGIVMRLGDSETIFKKGNWAFESGLVGSLQKENQKLQKHIETLEEEKNLLLLKFEVLLDMCTQATAENHLKDRELQNFRMDGEIS